MRFDNPKRFFCVMDAYCELLIGLMSEVKKGYYSNEEFIAKSRLYDLCVWHIQIIYHLHNNSPEKIHN